MQVAQGDFRIRGLSDGDTRVASATQHELRDIVAKFYTCNVCIAAYRKQVEYVITHTNTVTKKRYIDDPTIMAWELANEPRPMRPTANDAYFKWIIDSAAYIKSLDPNHLVTTGSEGWIGTVDKESGANPRLEMARREAVAVEIEQPLSRTTPGEAVGEAMHQAVVEGEHERRVDRVRRLDRCGVRCPDIPCLHSRHGWTV